MKNLEEKYQSYKRQRAQDKYEGDVEKGFPLQEFRQCVDYLAGVMEKVEFNDEDLSDIVTMARSHQTKGTGE